MAIAASPPGIAIGNSALIELQAAGLPVPYTPSGDTTGVLDTYGLQALSAALPQGSTIVLEPNATYYLNTKISLQAGQVIQGQHAKVWWPDQVINANFTRTTATSFTYTGTLTGVAVGQLVIFYTNASNLIYGTVTDVNTTTKVVTTTTMSTGLGSIANAAVCTLATAGAMFQLDTGCELRDIDFMCNNATYTFVWWAAHQDVIVKGSNIRVVGCSHNGSPCEGVIESAKTITAVSTLAVVGSNQLVVDSITGITAGTKIMAIDDITAGTGVKKQMRRYLNVLSYSGTGPYTLTLNGTLPVAFPVGSSVYVANENCEYIDNISYGIGGNQYHFSASYRTRALRNRIIKSNQFGDNAGHCGGGVTWSAAASETICEYNNVRDTPLCGFAAGITVVAQTGSSSSTLYSSDAKIRFNTLENCTQSGISCGVPNSPVLSTEAAQGWDICKNDIIDCGTNWLGSTSSNIGAGADRPTHKFRKNRIYRNKNASGTPIISTCALDLQYTANVVLDGNELYGYGAGSGTTAYFGINATDTVGLKIGAKTEIYGFYTGILVAANSATLFRDCNLRGLEVKHYYQRGIYDSSNACGKALKVTECVVMDNYASAPWYDSTFPASATSSAGITVGGRSFVTDNAVYHGASQSKGIYIASGVATVKRNVIDRVVSVAYQCIAQEFTELAFGSGSTGTSLVLNAAASSVDDFYTGGIIYVFSGTGVGQYARIIDYVGSTKTATIATAETFAVPPINTSTYSINSDIEQNVFLPVGSANALGWGAQNMTLPDNYGNGFA